MTQEELKNYDAIVKLVNEKFYLTKESQELFKEILYNQKHAVEYEKIYSQPDKRLFIDLDNNLLNQYDKSFANFYSKFSNFSKSNNLSYDEYASGIMKDKTKLIKSMKKFYSDTTTARIKELFGFMRLFKDLTLERWADYKIKIIKVLFKELFDKDIDKYEFPHSYYYDEDRWKLFEVEQDGTLKIYFKAKNLETGKYVGLKKKVTAKKYASALTKSGIFEEFTSFVNRDYLSLRLDSKLKVCLSLNFADWILASTGNNWSSCLNLLNSNGYWSGLPGLVGDPNRLMIFITDMQKKEYRGIESYKAIDRLWAFTMLHPNGKTYIYANKSYPKKEDFSLKIIMGCLPEDILIYNSAAREKNAKLVSKYPMPALFHTISKYGNGRRDNNPHQYNSFTTCIYEDSFHKKFLDRDRTLMEYTLDNEDNGCSCWAFSHKDKEWHNVNGEWIYNCSIDGIPAA